MAAIGTIFLAEDFLSENILREGGAHHVRAFHLSYQGSDLRVGLDVDKVSNSFALALIQDSVTWDCSDKEPVQYRRDAEFGDDAYLFIKGSLKEKRWRPRVTFLHPARGVLDSLRKAMEFSGVDQARFDDIDWEDPERLLLLVGKCVGQFRYACIWNLMQFQATIIASSNFSVVTLAESLCEQVGVELRQTDLSQLPQW